MIADQRGMEAFSFLRTLAKRALCCSHCSNEVSEEASVLGGAAPNGEL